MKWRNSKERELLSSGGNRDSTIPSKENPHPDLSDVPQNGQLVTSPNTESEHISNSEADVYDDDVDDDVIDFENEHSESFDYANYSDDSDEEINVS
jgi:hypothetical protein